MDQQYDRHSWGRTLVFATLEERRVMAQGDTPDIERAPTGEAAVLRDRIRRLARERGRSRRGR